MGEAKRKSALGLAIGSSLPAAKAVNADIERIDQQRKERVKEELRRLMAAVDEGRFECMIVSELIDNNGTPKVMTNMIGEVHQLQAAAGHVVEFYANKKTRGGKLVPKMLRV